MIKIWFVVIILQVITESVGLVVVRYPHYKASIEAMQLQFLTKEACQDGGEDVTRSVIRTVRRDKGKVTKAEWYCDFYEFRPVDEGPRIIHRNDFDKE